MRLRKIKNAKEKLEEYRSLVIFDPPFYFGKWQDVFGNSNPIYLEIGMGKGKFITEHAVKEPKINFIGCEVSESIILKAARNVEELKLKNLRLININANILQEVFCKGEISKIFLNFSDPWPKSRHSKRRLTSDEYIGIYQNIVVDGGIIELKTDNQNLFEYSLMKFNEYQFNFLDLSLDLHKNLENDIITTEYEEKFKNLGQKIFYIKVKI